MLCVKHILTCERAKNMGLFTQHKAVRTILVKSDEKQNHQKTKEHFHTIRPNSKMHFMTIYRSFPITRLTRNRYFTEIRCLLAAESQDKTTKVPVS